MQTTYNAIDKFALWLGGGLMLLGTVILGLVEVVMGPPYGAAPLTNDAGEVIATPFVDPNLRTGLFVLGLVVLLVWGLYRLAAPMETAEEKQVADMTAD